MNQGYMLFSTAGELVRIPHQALVYVGADGNYSHIHTVHGTKYVLSMQLGQVESRIAAGIGSDTNTFIRVGKSLIVNSRYIAYINTAKKRLLLSDSVHFKYEVEASREALKALKHYIENQGKI